MITFDQQLLRHRLDGIAPQGRVAYACSCAELLVPAFEVLAADEAAVPLVRSALDVAWDAASQPPSPDTEAIQAELLASYPDEDDGDYFVSAIGQNAIGAVLYSLKAGTASDSEDAGWAGVQVFEASEFSVGGPYEGRASAPLVQFALSSSEAALAAIERGASVADVRTRAADDGARLATLIAGMRAGHRDR